MSLLFENNLFKISNENSILQDNIKTYINEIIKIISDNCIDEIN